jgi:hypothetical protein
MHQEESNRGATRPSVPQGTKKPNFQLVPARGKFLEAGNLGQVCPATSKFVQKNAKSLLRLPPGAGAEQPAGKMKNSFPWSSLLV